MTKVAVVYTTKRYGGLDILVASLERQSYKDFILITFDELGRDHWWEHIAEHNKIVTIPVKPPIKNKGNHTNLAKCYNLAIEYALDYDCDLLVSLQDYIWAPPDGVERFVKCYEHNGDGFLYTGLTSISKDPESDKVYDENGYYTIFRTIYTEKPQIIDWHDARIALYSEFFNRGHYILTIEDSNHFEFNWAAIPTELFRQGLKWDEDYDNGWACAESALALEAKMRYNVKIVLDGENHAISLPHRTYFTENDIGTEANQRNMEKYAQALRESYR